MSYQLFYNYLENTTSREAFYEVLGVQCDSGGIVITRYGKIGSAGQLKVDYTSSARSVAYRAAVGKQGRHYRKRRELEAEFTRSDELLVELTAVGSPSNAALSRLSSFLADPSASTPSAESDEDPAPIKTKPLKVAKEESPAIPRPAAWGEW